MNSKFREVLIEALTSVNQENLTEPLFSYLTLLHKWNQAYNLTAIRDPIDMPARHLSDSLAILPWIKPLRILDVGTGPGLPGIPLALALPDCHVTLLDSNGKKIRFLREVKRTLGIKNIEIVESRIENYRPSLGFDTVTSRAFASIGQMLDWSRHLIAEEGIWLAMKGAYPEDELGNIPFPWKTVQYQVPGLLGERCCIIIENKPKDTS